MLLSGSQDGTVKCFDLRGKDSKLTFKRYTYAIIMLIILPYHHLTYFLELNYF